MTITLLVARTTLRWALLWGAVFGLFVLATIQAFVKGYPTVAERVELARSMSAFEILIGQGQRLDTAAGFTSWRVMTTAAIIGAIWALRTSTAMLRGEEEAGRWELLLAGPTTARRTTLQVLCGLGLALLAMFVVTAVFTFGASAMPAAHIHPLAALLQSISLVSGAAMFLAIGALASQFAATGGQATMLGSAALAFSYLLRLIADANSDLSGLRWATPLGWIEELRPLQNPQPLVLAPMLALIAACAVFTVLLAGRRDLNASILRERDTGSGTARWLTGATMLTLRLTRTAAAVWVLGIGAFVAVLGSLTHAASSVLTSGSPAVEATLRSLGLRQATAGYLGLIFLMTTIVVAMVGATQMVAMRDEESSGRLDNLLVRPVPRSVWFLGRVGIALALVIVAGVASGAFAWIGSANQHTGQTPLKLLQAGLNITPPGVFIIGAGALIFGLRPQLTGAVVYGIVAWSFVVDLVAALVKNADWLGDSSLFTHIALAPSVNPDWGADAIIAMLGVVLGALGYVAFQRRDIAYA